MEKTTVYYSPTNGGDGSVGLSWFLTAKAAEEHQDSLEEGWGEDCSGKVETYVGSNVYKEAFLNSLP